MTFTTPEFLWLLVVPPLAITLYLVLMRYRMRYAVRFTGVDVLIGVMDRRPRVRSFIPPVLFVAALISLILGMARPNANVLAPREDATVVLTMDASGSMSENDVQPSRLDAAKSAARLFMRQLPASFQIGLVSFADRAEVLAQPTTDRIAVREGIDSLSPFGATAIGDAIAESLRLDPQRRWLKRAHGRVLVPNDAAKTKPLAAILLLSDGSNTAGQLDPLEAAKRAKRLHLPVYTIALGPTEEQASDPFSASNQAPPDYQTLRTIAAMTGGRYFNAPSRTDLRSVYENLGSHLGLVRERQEVTFAFAGASLLLAGAAVSLSLLWRPRLP